MDNHRATKCKGGRGKVTCTSKEADVQIKLSQSRARTAVPNFSSPQRPRISFVSRIYVCAGCCGESIHSSFGNLKFSKPIYQQTANIDPAPIPGRMTHQRIKAAYGKEAFYRFKGGHRRADTNELRRIAPAEFGQSSRKN